MKTTIPKIAAAYLLFLVSANGMFIADPAVKGFIKCDEILCVSASDLAVSHVTGNGQILEFTANRPIVIRGKSADQIQFESISDYPSASDCRYYLVFLKQVSGRLFADTTGSIMGFDQEIPNFNGQFDDLTNSFDLIKRMFFSERSVPCSLLEAYLLSQAPPELLKDISKQTIVYAQVDKNPLRAFAALTLLLQCDGIGALQEISIPDFNKALEPIDGVAPFGVATYYANSLKNKILGWIYDHKSPAAYSTLAKFAKTQSGESRAKILISIRPYATERNIKDIIEIFKEDPDLKVKYAAMTNLCNAFGEPIPSIDQFQSKYQEMVAYWTQRIGRIDGTIP